jgi:hypothetical protein
MSQNFYYHYSTRENIQKIAQSGEIRPSTDTTRDAMLGPGVYLTSKPPQCSDRTLAKNNYGENASEREPRVESYIRIPKDQLPDVCCQRSGRDVCIKPGDAIDLSKVDYGVGDRKRYGR